MEQVWFITALQLCSGSIAMSSPSVRLSNALVVTKRIQNT